MVALTIVVVLGALLFNLLSEDEFGPGTSHRYTLVRAGTCANPSDVLLDDRSWGIAGVGTAERWSDWTFPLPGTFHIERDGMATFFPDSGGSLPFKGGGEFSSMICAVE